MKFLRPVALLAAALIAAGPALAAGPIDMAIHARKGLMDNFAFNIGLLGGMAKGAIPYDAAQASAAANNLAALASVDMTRYWPKGSDDMSAENTHALPAIWDKPDDFTAADAGLRKAVTGMQAAAGTDLAALQGAMGPLGGACGACHKAFRAPLQ